MHFLLSRSDMSWGCTTTTPSASGIVARVVHRRFQAIDNYQIAPPNRSSARTGDDPRLHRTTPHHGRIRPGKKAGNRKNLDAIGRLVRFNHAVAALGRKALDPGHERHVRSVDIGIDDADIEATGSKSVGQVNGNRGLPDTTLSAHYKHFVLDFRHLQKRCRGVFLRLVTAMLGHFQTSRTNQ